MDEGESRKTAVRMYTIVAPNGQADAGNANLSKARHEKIGNRHDLIHGHKAKTGKTNGDAIPGQGCSG